MADVEYDSRIREDDEGLDGAAKVRFTTRWQRFKRWLQVKFCRHPAVTPIRCGRTGHWTGRWKCKRCEKDLGYLQ